MFCATTTTSNTNPTFHWSRAFSSVICRLPAQKLRPCQTGIRSQNPSCDEPQRQSVRGIHPADLLAGDTRVRHCAAARSFRGQTRYRVSANQLSGHHLAGGSNVSTAEQQHTRANDLEFL